MKLKAIFFDLDNTLCRYRVGWEEARAEGIEQAYQVLRAHHPEIALPDWQRAFERATEEVSPFWEEPVERGLPLGRERTRRALKNLGLTPDKDATELVDELTWAFYEAVLEHLELFPDADEVLRELHPRFVLGIITNGPADVQRTKIEHLRLHERVDHVLISGELGVAKPDPRIFHKALELAEARPEAFLFVGDHPEADVGGAKGAGLWAAWLNRKRLPAPDGLDADFVFESLLDLLPHLEPERSQRGKATRGRNPNPPLP